MPRVISVCRSSARFILPDSVSPRATSRVTELYARDYLVNPKVNVSLHQLRQGVALGSLAQVNRREVRDAGMAARVESICSKAVAMAGG